MAICLGGDEFDRSITDFSSGRPTRTTPTLKHSYRRPHRPHAHCLPKEHDAANQ